MSNRAPWIVATIAIVVLGLGWYRSASRQIGSENRTERSVTIPQINDAAPSARPQTESREAFAARIESRAKNRAASARLFRETIAERERKKAELGSRLDNKFAADGLDPRWSAQTEATATRLITDPVMAGFHAPTDVDLRCASTMCRMVLTFDSFGAASDWATYYPTGMARELPVIQSLPFTLADGRVELRMYAFRDRNTTPLR